MRIFLIIIFLFGCGSHTKIEYHEVSREKIIELSNSVYSVGWSEWEDYEAVVYCDIYLLPKEQYIDDTCYNDVVSHERRHCYEFDYHSGDNKQYSCNKMENYSNYL
jgi:hypothetical protein